jgi:hypothetical protein
MFLGLDIMADTCNSSYLGGKDQEEHDSKPAWEKSQLEPYLNQQVGNGAVCLTSQLLERCK